jgi:hypothetical protein
MKEEDRLKLPKNKIMRVKHQHRPQNKGHAFPNTVLRTSQTCHRIVTLISAGSIVVEPAAALKMCRKSVPRLLSQSLVVQGTTKTTSLISV